MANSLDILEAHRNALLLAEVAAWLHMFGKFQKAFLDGNADVDIAIPQLVKQQFSHLDDALTQSWVGKIWSSLPEINSIASVPVQSISSLITTHRKPDNTEGLLKLLWDGHGRGSNIEKGVLAPFASPQTSQVYLSTATGFEGRPIDSNDLETQRIKLYTFLQTELVSLKNKNAQLNLDEWQAFRLRFVPKIGEYFRTSVAETRRPLNDVSLFDQTFLTVAFFKAALAQNLLIGWKDPAQTNTTAKYKWRLIRIGIDSLAFWGNSARSSDIVVRKDLVAKALDQVKDLLETEYPLGTEIYRDAYGSTFIVPDVEDLLTVNTPKFIALKEQLQQIACTVFDGETEFAIQPISDPTRNTLLFGRLAAQLIAKPSPTVEWLKYQWNSAGDNHVCAVCGLRPQGPTKKSSDRRVCDVCEKRRIDRLKTWLKNLSGTIWIDEVADTNGQMALIVGQFGIEKWLSGEAFNTVLAFDPQTRLLGGNVNNEFNMQQLIDNIQVGLRPNSNFDNSNLLGKLVKKDSRGKKIGNNGKEVPNTVKDFYDLQIQDTDLATGTVGTRKAEILALAMIRQNPSFARIRRVWESTQNFWLESQKDFANLENSGSQRLSIKGQVTQGEPPVPNHAYEIKLNGKVSFSVACKTEREFVSIENLDYIVKLLGGIPEKYKGELNPVLAYFKEFLKQQQFQVEEPTGYGSSNKPKGILVVSDIELMPETYVPAINILAEPRTFMVLVPADKAMEVATTIQEKYEREMGKVRNRLPLNLGIVFAGRRTPLSSVLDAGRRMLKYPVKTEEWTVCKIEPELRDANNWPKEVELTLEQAGQKLTLCVPTVMGDSSIQDVWYPYWQIISDVNGAKPVGRERQFEGPNQNIWVHVCDLKPGDTVSFTPSRFDFEYLDTGARRFEISYQDGKRRGLQNAPNKTRPYYLEQISTFSELWGILSNLLHTTQIKDLDAIIECKRLEWHDQAEFKAVFEAFVENVIKNAQWGKARDKDGKAKRLITPEQIQEIKVAAKSGMLSDVIELYTEILKQKSKVDEEAETNNTQETNQ